MIKIKYFYPLLFILFSLLACFNSFNEEELLLREFFDSKNITLKNKYKGIVFIPLEGCSCAKYGAEYFNKSGNEDLLFVFSANSEKYIKMNIDRSLGSDNLVLDGKNLSVKIGIVGDYVKLFKLDSEGKVVKTKEIEAAIAKDFYKKEIVVFFGTRDYLE